MIGKYEVYIYYIRGTELHTSIIGIVAYIITILLLLLALWNTPLVSRIPPANLSSDSYPDSSSGLNFPPRLPITTLAPSRFLRSCGSIIPTSSAHIYVDHLSQITILLLTTSNPSCTLLLTTAICNARIVDCCFLYYTFDS